MLEMPAQNDGSWGLCTPLPSSTVPGRDQSVVPTAAPGEAMPPWHGLPMQGTQLWDPSPQPHVTASSSVRKALSEEDQTRGSDSTAPRTAMLPPERPLARLHQLQPQPRRWSDVFKGMQKIAWSLKWQPSTQLGFEIGQKYANKPTRSVTFTNKNVSRCTTTQQISLL